MIHMKYQILFSLADDSHERFKLFFSKKKKKNASAASVISTVRVNRIKSPKT